MIKDPNGQPRKPSPKLRIISWLMLAVLLAGVGAMIWGDISEGRLIKLLTISVVVTILMIRHYRDVGKAASR